MSQKKQRRAQQQTREKIKTEKPAQTQSREPVAESPGFIPLVNCDSVYNILALSKYNTSLLECIRIIHTREGGLFRPRLRELTLLSWQVAHLVDSAALRCLERVDNMEKRITEFLSGDDRDELAGVENSPTRKTERRPDYQDTPVRTRRVMALYRVLMVCIHDITRGEDDALKPYLADLTALAREISLTVRQSLKQSLKY